MIEPSPQVPLSIEPIVGWRVWRLGDEVGKLSLLSLRQYERWPAGVPIRARCLTHVGAGVPNIDCSCGIYAADSPAHLARAGAFDSDACVVGAVAMWGTVVEHATGARSEIAYPDRLRLICAVCLHEGRGGVQPAFVFGSGLGSVAVARCRRHSLGQPGPSRAARLVEGELLSTYGVEVMPLARVARPLRHRAIRRTMGGEGLLWGAVRGVFATIGFLIQAYIVLSLLLAVVTIGFAVIGNIVQVFVHTDPSPARAASVVPAPAIGPVAALPRSEDLPPRTASVPPPFRFAVVCGDPASGSIRIVRCGGEHDVLLGFAKNRRPQGAESDCAGVWDVYSRGDDYSICWIAVPGQPDISRHLASDDPFGRMHRTVS